MNKRSEKQGKNLKKKKSPSKDSHDQPFNDMHLHDPLQLAIGLASVDVTAERDAWKRIATGKTGSKQR